MLAIQHIEVHNEDVHIDFEYNGNDYTINGYIEENKVFIYDEDLKIYTKDDYYTPNKFHEHLTDKDLETLEQMISKEFQEIT